MVSDAKQLHILFFPFMGPGHFIPMIDMACIFASHNVRSTLVTPPFYASKIPLSKSKYISIVTVPFPSPSLTNLPPEHENLATIPSSMLGLFFSALPLLQSPLQNLIHDLKPDCLISDYLFPWTADLALQFKIPRIVYPIDGALVLCTISNIFSHFPLDESKEEFFLDGLPEKIKLYRKGLPEMFRNIPFLIAVREAEAKSYGVVVNTFREMEPTYVDFYKETTKAWCIGPVSSANKLDKEEITGWMAEQEEVKEKIVKWLDGKEEGSVVYVCFGSGCHFSGGQLRELALGLEKCNMNFLWAVRKEPEGDDVKEKEWMPENYKERVGERGLVVKGWVPQTTVLDHKSVGWFLSHCGWNSFQESTSAGVPMITWPLYNEQFINTEFLVETMGIGERMWEGFRKSEYRKFDDVIVSADEIAGVVGRVMGGGEKYEEMKRKAKVYGEKAKKAVEEGGSSYNDVVALIEELKTLQSCR